MRLVATDLDGTLLRPDGSLSPRTLAALHRCRDHGVGVIYVTGRPLRWMPQVAAAGGHQGVALCSNGATVVDLIRGEVVRSWPFEQDALGATIQALRRLLSDARFGMETVTGPLWEIGFPTKEVLNPLPPRAELSELLAMEPRVIKLLCHSQLHTADELLKRARDVLTQAEPVHSNPNGQLLEIAAAGVTKAGALARYAAERGVAAAEVIAFGDMPNDVAMLRWAGVGYAMANGHPQALAAADRHAPPAALDGVAQVLESLLP